VRVLEVDANVAAEIAAALEVHAVLPRAKARASPLSA
jgi:hypothetical protein